MRTIFCPACALEAELDNRGFRCRAGPWLSIPLGQTIRHAVFGVDRPGTEPRAPGLIGHLTCPSCTADLVDFTSDDRFLRCAYCPLQLPATNLVQLENFRLAHPEPDDWDGVGELYKRYEENEED